jgi:hypothetical protein
MNQRWAEKTPLPLRALTGNSNVTRSDVAPPLRRPPETDWPSRTGPTPEGVPKRIVQTKTISKRFN